MPRAHNRITIVAAHTKTQGGYLCFKVPILVDRQKGEDQELPFDVLDIVSTSRGTSVLMDTRKSHSIWDQKSAAEVGAVWHTGETGCMSMLWNV